MAGADRGRVEGEAGGVSEQGRRRREKGGKMGRLTAGIENGKTEIPKVAGIHGTSPWPRTKRKLTKQEGAAEVGEAETESDPIAARSQHAAAFSIRHGADGRVRALKP